MLFLLAGFLLLAASVLLGRLFSAHYPNAPYAALIGFICVWLLLAAGNLWVGVAKAGYSFAEELPIFLLIGGLPVAVAIVLKWKFL
jgi:hypothetical protein